MNNTFLLLCLLLCCSDSNAQIIHFDVNKSFDLASGGYACNLDKPDSLTHINYFTPGCLQIPFEPAYISANSASMDAVQVLTESTGTYPLALDAGFPIDSTGIWKMASSSPLNDNGAYGNWIGVTNKYLAIRFPDSGKMYYGWVCMSIDHGPNTLYIKDRAYNSISRASIKTGQTSSTGLPKVENRNIQLIVSNKTIRISGITNDIPIFISVSDITGRLLLRNIDLHSNRFIDMSAYYSGIYIVYVSASDFNYIQKIIL